MILLWWTFAVGCKEDPPAPVGPDDTVVDTDTIPDPRDTADTDEVPPDDTDQPVWEDAPECPRPLWLRVLSGEGWDSIGWMATTTDGGLGVVGRSRATRTFDAGDGPIVVDWTDETAWVAVVEPEDGALRWVTPVARQAIPDFRTGLFTMEATSDGGLVAAGELDQDGTIAPGSTWEQPANTGDTWIVRLGSDGSITGVLVIAADFAAVEPVWVFMLRLATAPTGQVLLSGSSQGSITIGGHTVDLGEYGWFVAEMAPDFSVTWAWGVEGARPAAAFRAGDTWLAGGAQAFVGQPVLLPSGLLAEGDGFVVQFDQTGADVAVSNLEGDPVAYDGDTVASTEVVFAQPFMPAVQLAPLAFAPLPTVPVTLLTQGPGYPMVSITDDRYFVTGLADRIYAPAGDAPPLVADLTELTLTTTVFAGADDPLCVVVTDGAELLQSAVLSDDGFALSGSIVGSVTLDALGPAPLFAQGLDENDAFVARLSPPPAAP
jgi:hypothetical protein